MQNPWSAFNVTLFIIPKMFSNISFQFSHVCLFVTPWTAEHQASLSITNSWSLFKLMSIHSVMPSNHLILCCPHLVLPSIFPSIRVFSNESVLHIRWPKYWSFSFSISSSNGYSGLIQVGCPCSPRDSQKSLPKLQLKSISSSVLSFLYSPPFTSKPDYWKTIALTRQTFVGRVISLLFNMLSKSVIDFLPRSKCLFIP